ncbi:leucine-rich repeat-containing protein 31 isoform X1 [Boleophthalmus pectinirostris]|uniref:leucine-rich repeat-containing protein 31 isoform X1 n=1 Tax=Boleophthalmus pectinirostris TaxID=150288 RepID=UPI002430A7A0|nr:leucine-rich repeat-containing protein 31 isoform X1 [Boleophthalmus pectinirostris]
MLNQRPFRVHCGVFLGTGGSVRRSPLDLIMNQIRRKRSDRRPLGRLLSWASERTVIREDEPDAKVQSPAVPESDEEQGMGWGRVRAFLHRFGSETEKGRINLSHCDLTATDLLELGTLLPYVPLLEDLDLSWNDLIGGSLRALSSHLNHMNCLSALRLSGCRLNHQDLSALGDALSCLPSVEVLDLSWNGALGGGGLQGLVGKLQPTLTELHLVACELTAADGTSLGEILSSMSCLSVLDLSCNPNFTDGVKDVCSALSKNTSLKTLRLQAVGLAPLSLQALGESLQFVPSLRLLDLSCNKGLSGHLSLLSPHLSHLSLLETLDLHLSGLTRSDIQALVQVLPSLISLTDLNVSSNQETGDTVHTLIPALPLTHMKRLPLNNCDLTHKSYTALVVAVPYLRCVDVSWCKVVGGRLLLLLEALQPSVLQELRLSSCELNTQDIQHLASVCHGGFLSSLRVLDLSYNGSVGSNGWSSLFTSGGLGSLEELDLSLRPITSAPCSDWLPALLRALPRLTALKRLGLQRWTIGGQEKLQLDHSLRKRNVLLEMDTEETSQDKEIQPEE